MKFDIVQCLYPSRNLIVAGVSVAGVYLAYQIHATLKKRQRRKKWNKAGKDVVVLHQMRRGKFVPSTSPFPLKLETYLRMSGITYENDFDEPRGPKGKMPWITLNGEEIADSQLCIELLARKFNKDLKSHLTKEEIAAAHALQIMAEEHLQWVFELDRFVYNKGRDLPHIISNVSYIVLKLFTPLIYRNVKKAAYYQGIGRHSRAEVYEMGIKDMQALSYYLGQKPFITGEKPTEVDCAIFGMLANIVFNDVPNPFKELLDGEYINLKDYCVRMRDLFWPDWNRCIDPPII